MIDAVLASFAFNLHYAGRLLGDIPAESMCEQPLPGMNHPTWIIGHLADTCDLMADWMEVEGVCPPGWHDLFDNRSAPQADPSVYPEPGRIYEVLELGHSRMSKALRAAPDEILHKPLPRESMRSRFPTVLDGVVFEMTDHEAIHLGQLSAWRRAMGMGRA